MAGLREGGNEPPGFLKSNKSKAAYSTELVRVVRCRNIFAFSSDERAFNIESYFRTEVKIEFTVRKALFWSRAVASWSKAFCLGLALRNARWFESSWGKKFSHEISASVWDRCPTTIVIYLGSYDSRRLFHYGNLWFIKRRAIVRPILQSYRRSTELNVLRHS
ncbi:hypothetical protein ANN_10614 [Periplaneta americana]|uniref:Per a allergen n=1 Tax=Periplaneta americana TaxID=6978 RepID=A0ABQ8TSA0_PERAM|nr:hypothetical protein ANN_10614 [Periplaneta americana]